MPDDERTRRRLGDETKAKIADLASGWTVDPAPPVVDPPKSSVPVSTPKPVAAAKSAPVAVPTPAPAAVAKPAPIAAGPAPAIDPTRKKSKTVPPPPPGSAARAELEIAIVEAADTPPPEKAAPKVGSSTGSNPAVGPKVGASTGSSAAMRPVGSTSPPPLPPPRAKPTMPPVATAPTMPAIPAAPTVDERAATPIATNAVAGTIGGDTGAFKIGEQVGAVTGQVAVPRGEFDDGGTAVEPDKLRIAHSQATIKRDAASALLGIAEAPLTQVKPVPVEVLLTESAQHLRDDPTNVDPSTSKFERGDPTALGRADSTGASASTVGGRPKGGRLRTVAALRRQRGVLGDVRYVLTATLGARKARQELEQLEGTQQRRQEERRKHILILGRTAVTSDAFDHPALGPAREQMIGVEEERARHRGQVVAADQELERVKRDRETKAKQYVVDISAVDAELAELQKRLEPLLKEQAQVTRRGADLRDSLRRIDAQIAETTASLVSVKGPKQDAAAIQAEIATLKADRVAVQRDEPKIASELDGLNPKIAGLEAKRGESQKRRAELVKAEEDDQRRSEELLAAIGAKRKVMDRAAGDAETLRDKILFELGERLYVDRPDALAAQLSPVDTIDVELGTGDRRVMELKEILSSIDRWKLARGVAVIILALAALGSFVGWILYMTL